MDFTPDQRDAIYDHESNLIVTAGAGSGKTRVLVERYLALLEANPDWPLNALVAITFTRAAAAEMRDRVRQSLEQRLHDDPDNAERWTRLLSQMDAARIDTIHGLCGSILRANAAEAGIDPRFEVIEANNASLLLREVVDDVMQRVASSMTDDMRPLFVNYETSQITKVLTSSELFAYVRGIPPRVQTVSDWWRLHYQKTSEQVLQSLRNDTEFLDALEWSPPALWPRDDKLMAGWEIVHNNRFNLLRGTTEEIFEALAQLSTINLQGGKANDWGGKGFFEECKANLRLIRDRVRGVLKQIGSPLDELDDEAAAMIPRWHTLLRMVAQRYQQIKTSRGWLDFDDLEQLTVELLEKSDDVARRYQGNEFRHLLVDEFQDTNDRQWRIVQALSNHKEHGGRLFVVGDEKQSIYGFRGADVSVFGDVRQKILDGKCGRSIPLAVSFRSHPALISAFNGLFRRMLVRDETSPVAAFEVQFGDAMSAYRQDEPDTPCISLMLVDPEAEGETFTSDARREIEAEVIALHLRELVKQGLTVFDREAPGQRRPMQYGDIALLFQAMTKINIYEDAFKRVGVPYITEAGRGFYDRQEIWDVLNVLRTLYNSADDLALAAALRSPIFGFSDEWLLRLRRWPEAGKPAALWEAIQHYDDIFSDELARTRAREASELLIRLRKGAGRVAIAELISEVLSATGYLATLSALPDGPRLRRNVEKLVDIARESGRIALGEFSRYLEQIRDQDVREGEASLEAEGAVRFMTVHASKGLEFPMVVVPDSSRDTTGGNNRSPVLIHDPDIGLACRLPDVQDDQKVLYAYRIAVDRAKRREEAESKRKLYVAATRAKDYLLISGAKGRSFNASWFSQLLESFGIDVEDIRDSDVAVLNEGVRLRLHLISSRPEPLEDEVYQEDASESMQTNLPPEAPPLLAKVPHTPGQRMGHITVSQLGRMGGYEAARRRADTEQEHYYRSLLRADALEDAPARMDQVLRRDPKVTGRMIGEIVHEVLRHWYFDDNPDLLEERLHAYAWRQGISDPELAHKAVRDARQLIQKFRKSRVYGWINAALEEGRPFYTEMPFVFRTDKRILHGVMDTLFQRADDQWVIVDYKTGSVADSKSGLAAFEQHAVRYHLQVGAYAAAVREHIGQMPEVHIHYIRYNQTVAIPEKIWQAALDTLESTVGDILR